MGKFIGYVVKVSDSLFLLDYEDYSNHIENVLVSFNSEDAYVFSDLRECENIANVCRGRVYKKEKVELINFSLLEDNYDDIT